MKKFRSIFAIVLVIAMLFSLNILYSSAEAINSYTSLVSAIEAASAGDTITLTGSVSFDYEDGDQNADIIIDKDLTIDLNGNAIQYCGDDGNHAFEIRGANVVFKDSNPGLGYFRILFGEDNSLFHVTEGGTVTADNLKVCIENDNTVFSAYCGNIIIDGGSYDVLNSSYVFTADGEEDDHSTITIKNGSIFETLNTTINTYETTIGDIANTDLTIEDGTFAEFFEGIFIRSGSATINGGSFETTGIVMHTIEEYGYPTTIEINGGTFHSKNQPALNIHGGNVTINSGDFTTDTNDAVSIINYSNHHKDNQVEINGGTFTTTAPQEVGPFSSYFVAVDASYTSSSPTDDLESYKLPLVINGGTFTASYGPALKIMTDATITGGTFNGLSTAATFANMLNTDTNNISLSGGTFNARARTADDDTYAPEDFFKIGDTSMVSGISIIDYRENMRPTNYISSGYSLYGESKKVESFKCDDDTGMFGYYTEEPTLIILPDAKILVGDSTEIDKDNIADTLFKSNIDFSYFKEVKVDGKTVDSSNYTAASGSTDITLKASFLKTLANGKHTLQIISDILGNKVVAETTFTIAGDETETTTEKTTVPVTKEETTAPVEETTTAAEETTTAAEETTTAAEETTTAIDDAEEVANTADTNMAGLYIALCGISVAAVIIMIKKKVTA